MSAVDWETSTILMAQAYPKSTFVGFDYHAGSIELAREAAAKAGVSDRVKFEVASAKQYPGKGYDFVAFFDCLHDMGDPEGAARHVLETLDPNGTWMIVEPFANDKLEDNLNPIGRVFLFGFDHVVHAGFTFAGGWPGFGSSSGRGTAREGVAFCGIHAGAARDGDTVQHRSRSATVRSRALS